MVERFISKLIHLFRHSWQYRTDWRIVDGKVYEYTITRKCTRCEEVETLYHWDIFDEYLKKTLLQMAKACLLHENFGKNIRGKTIKFRRYGRCEGQC